MFIHPFKRDDDNIMMPYTILFFQTKNYKFLFVNMIFLFEIRFVYLITFFIILLAFNVPMVHIIGFRLIITSA